MEMIKRAAFMEMIKQAALEYLKYHHRVVGECVALMGKHNRAFFDTECTYFDEWRAGEDPHHVARNQMDAIR